MMLLATVFVACSDDDKDDDKPTGKVKLVSKIVTSNSKGTKESEETFEYDSQGRVTKYKYYNIDEAYNGKPAKFLYNSDKYLVKAEKEGYSEILTWSNENLLKIGDDMSFTYTEYENKSNIDIISINFTEDAEFDDILFRSGYFGNRSKKLILMAKSHDHLHQYEYTFDNEGYVSNIKDIKSGYTQTITYKE